MTPALESQLKTTHNQAMVAIGIEFNDDFERVTLDNKTKRFPLPEEEFYKDDQQLMPGASEPNAQLDDSGNERGAMYRDQERFMYPSYPNTSSCYQSEYVDGYREAKYETWQYPYQQKKWLFSQISFA